MADNDKTVLVVEDERPLAEAIKAKLERRGLGVVTVRTAGQALDYLQEAVPIDAVWLDHYLLGKEDGLDLLVKLKEEKSVWRHIPIFVVSNTASADKVRAYLQLGVEKYYVKSEHRLAEIVEELSAYLQKSSTSDAITEAM